MTVDLDLLSQRRGYVGPTFTRGNRLRRLLWAAAWLLLARWTPPPLHRWRVLLLRAFGASVSWNAYVYSDVRIWAPWNLSMADHATLAPRVTCYNIAPIRIGRQAVVSQGAHLCTGTHDYKDPAFPLTARAIAIGARAWVCADAIVGPGVEVGEGAILGLGAVALRNLERWTIYAGNPAVPLKARPVLEG
jgi:putative colanic acid biosynthesis acetyltransferase WcaF